MRKIVKVEENGEDHPGEFSRYGNPPSWTVHYDCGHSSVKPHSAGLSTKAVILRKFPNAYLRGRCSACVVKEALSE